MASFISSEFNCDVTKEDIDLYYAEQSEEDYSVESNKIKYYGSTIRDD